MADKFLNATGLAALWEKIKTYVTQETAKVDNVDAGRSNIGTDTESGFVRVKNGDYVGAAQAALLYDLTQSTDTLDLLFETSGEWDKDRQFVMPTTAYVDGLTGDPATLTTDNKANLVNAINEVYEKSGEPFRVKDWNVEGTLNVTVPSCNQDISNTSIDKFLYRITGQEATNYQIVGMVAYQLLDASNSRINAWPVCQFTGQGQTELNVRFMCAGTTNKTAKTIKAWVLLKHR